MSYYLQEEVIQGHHQQHRLGRSVTRQRYCVLCYPRPTHNRTSRAFQRFWNWLTTRHNAYSYTNYTISAFTEIQTRLTIAVWTPDKIIQAISLLISSIRYNLPLTPFEELGFTSQRLLQTTSGFNRDITRADITEIHNAYLIEWQNLINQQANIRNEPEDNQTATMNNNMTEQQIRTMLNNLLGQNGLNVTGLATGINNAVTAL